MWAAAVKKAANQRLPVRHPYKSVFILHSDVDHNIKTLLSAPAWSLSLACFEELYFQLET